MSSTNDTKTQLAQSIVAWLKDSNTQQGAADAAQLEQAAKSISSAFNLPSSSASSGPGLQTIYDVFLKTQSKMGGGAASTPAAAASSSSAPAADKPAPSAEAIAQADQHKTDGNKSMSSKDYSSAIASYTKAIDLNPNPVYYSNRAAAYSQVGQHDKAIDDARHAAQLDPKFGKAYSRLGHALFSSGKYSEAVDAYQQGLLVDPENKLMKSGLETAKAQAEKEGDSGAGPSSAAATRDAPGAGAGAGAGGGFGGFPGMGGGGGMPDLASLMNNPQMAAMAQQMMQNGGLEQLMQNPMLRRMAENMGSGGGMPDMSQLGALMQDPQMRQLAQQFAGGMGRGGGQGGQGGQGGNPGNMFG